MSGVVLGAQTVRFLRLSSLRVDPLRTMRMLLRGPLADWP
jgi:hypothetical protein